MTPRSQSLICQLSSPTSSSKKDQSMERYLNRSPSKNKGCHDFSNQRRDQFAPLLSGTRRKKRMRQSILVGFWSAPGSWHVSHFIKNARNRWQDMPADHFLDHHSAVPEAIPSEDTTTLRTPILRPLSRAPRSRSIGYSHSEQHNYSNRAH